MNILVISQMYSQPDDVGDNKPTKTVNYFVKEWVKKGHSVVVIHCSSRFPLPMYYIPERIKKIISGSTSKIIPSPESRKMIEWDDNGAKVYRLPMFKMFPGMSFSRRAMNLQKERIKKILQKKHFCPEVVMGHFANPCLQLVAELSTEYKAMSSVVFHQDCNEHTIRKYRIKEYSNKVGAIGTRSIIEANSVKSLLHLEKLPFICYSGVPNSVVDNANRICNKHVKKEKLEYIYVGSLIKRKNVDSVIKAFVEKYHDNRNAARLTIIGGGAEEFTLKSLVNKLDAGDLVVFTGRIPREEVMLYMKNADVFTLISKDEVYGMVYIEAMLQGCLVVASKGEGFDGFIVDGENGFLCSPGNEKMLKSVYDHIEDMSLIERNRVGQNAVDYAIGYSEEAVAERYLNDVLSRNEEKN